MHWTAFNRDQLEVAGDVFAQLREGTLVISFTNPIPNPDYEILIKDAVEVSWGQAIFYVQVSLSLSLRFKGLLLYTVGVLFHMECCIRQLWRSLIVLYSITSIASNHYTDIYPLLNT